MVLNPDAVGAQAGPTEASWTSKDSLLYALGVGAGSTDPTGAELEFTTENSDGVTQQALPTMPVVITPADGGNKALMGSVGEFDMANLVHGEQAVVLHQPVPAEGTAMITARVAAMHDKGSAAVIVFENDARDGDGNLLWTTQMSAFIRGAGGWGGDRGPSGPKNAPPDRAPDQVVTLPTRADQALLYRLSGDRNPLHSDPSFAIRAGFETPILHGLCTYGFTGRALLNAVCDGDPTRFGSIEGRFSRPVLPGQTLTVEIWADGSDALFRTLVADTVVIDSGRVTFR